MKTTGFNSVDDKMLVINRLQLLGYYGYDDDGTEGGGGGNSDLSSIFSSVVGAAGKIGAAEVTASSNNSLATPIYARPLTTTPNLTGAGGSGLMVVLIAGLLAVVGFFIVKKL